MDHVRLRTIVISLLVAAGILFLYYIPLKEPFFSLQLPRATENTADWRTYTNQLFSLSLKYPPIASTQSGSTGPLPEFYNLGPNTKIFSVNIPRSFQSRTNFDGASLVAETNSDKNVVDQCLNPPADQGFTDAFDQRMIGGTVFHTFTHQEGAAGNFYELTSYRAVRNGSCFVFTSLIHYDDIGNYPPESGIKEYNKASVTNLLETILDTVHFTR
jgi:hypothetical protein